MAPMLQLQLRTWMWIALVLCVFAGPWRQTDGQLHTEGHADDNVFYDKLEDANIILELFWEGLEIEANKTIRLQDEELASLRSTKRLLQIFQHQVPKTPEGIKEQLEYLSQADAPLSLVEFDQLLFTSVYCAYQIRSIQGLDKNLWISFFSQLVDEIIHDLCKGFCPANSTLLASWPWKEKPFYLTSLKKMYHSNPAMMKRGTE
ncbi:protein FAM180B [Pelodiscus sinensis]|uniref:Family with sequence similarity 180 member B n=1 Tax=Pelodiscus sinensis TaxID=13735 RepID=K7F7S2_PELSI|nr:protein FAM180B [Pelodiscus sinensis]|eukprot:XP_014424134.1 protein FAM180B [Pelodiscus sinensis]